MSVNRLPPEVLGDIFHWNVIPSKGDFGELMDGSHNFLHVCRHWSEVASHTPSLWSFCGSTLSDWARWCCYSKTTPLDLVLFRRDCSSHPVNIDKTLLNALRGRVNWDAIRRVHLSSDTSAILRFILSSLTPKVEGVWSNGMESFILKNGGYCSVNLSNFFARHRFQRLRRLEIVRCTISSWDHLITGAGTLTDLSLDLKDASHRPTTSQLLAILSSNPLLQRVKLSHRAVPGDGGGPSGSPRVPLHHLVRLELAGSPQDVLGLLGRLDHPAALDLFAVDPYECTVTKISNIIRPYFQSHFQRHDRSQSRLGLDISCGNRIVLSMGKVDPHFTSIYKSVALNVYMGENRVTSVSGRVEAALELIKHCPPEELVFFQGFDKIAASGDICTRLRELKALHVRVIGLPITFLKHDPGGGKDILPRLQSLVLDLKGVMMGDSDWGPLRALLAARDSSGKQLSRLNIGSLDKIPPEMVNGIEKLVQELNLL